MQSESGRRRRAAIMIGSAILLAAVGCASITARAPLVTAEMTAAAAAHGHDPAALERGRDLYVGRCTRCHRPVAVTGRTPRQWQKILPRMADEARLDPSEMADVADYIDAAGGAAVR